MGIRINCLLCKQATDWSQRICVECLRLLPVLGHACVLCANPIFSESLMDTHCAQCIQEKPYFDESLSVFLYEFPIDRIIQRIKYEHRLELLHPLALSLAKAVQKKYVGRQFPEVIIPVPLHHKRLRERGFNQSFLLARKVHRFLMLDNKCLIDKKVVSRIKNTKSQQGLSFMARKKNVKQIFSISSKLEGYKHVAILDDVVTSTSTVNSISRLLKEHNVSRVDVWSLVRTPYSMNNKDRSI